MYYVTGILLMSTGFLFLNRQFKCADKGLLSSACDTTVCALPREEWNDFIIKSDSDFDSIATEIGEDGYYC